MKKSDKFTKNASTKIEIASGKISNLKNRIAVIDSLMSEREDEYRRASENDKVKSEYLTLYIEKSKISKEIETLIREIDVLSSDRIFINAKIHTDVVPFEVIECDVNKMVCRRMDVVPSKGSEPMSNEWDYISSETNPDVVFIYNKRKDRWIIKDNAAFAGCLALEPVYRFDYSF